MKLFITGGAGFIGSAVVRNTIKRGYSVINFDALTYAGCLGNVASVSNASNYRFIHGDIRDRSALDRAFQEHRPSVIMHLAAESHVDRSIDGPKDFIETNIVGTYNLLEAARTYWTSAGKPDWFRLHHISTDEVFGSLSKTGKFTENTPYDPRSPYSASKASSDHLVRSWYQTYGLPTVISNCSNNYGPYHLPEKLIPLMIINAVDGKPLPIYGKGENVRDWLYVEDHVDALLTVFEKGTLGEVYCVGGDSEKTNLDLCAAVIQILDNTQPRSNRESYATLITHVTDRLGHDFRYAIDATKIKNELGWQPITEFSDGLEKTVQWYLDNENWWRPLLARICK